MSRYEKREWQLRTKPGDQYEDWRVEFEIPEMQMSAHVKSDGCAEIYFKDENILWSDWHICSLQQFVETFQDLHDKAQAYWQERGDPKDAWPTPEQEAEGEANLARIESYMRLMDAGLVLPPGYKP